MKMIFMMTVLFIGTGMMQDEITYRTKAWLMCMIVLIILITYMSF